MTENHEMGLSQLPVIGEIEDIIDGFVVAFASLDTCDLMSHILESIMLKLVIPTKRCP